jgi:hypothetical protein
VLKGGAALGLLLASCREPERRAFTADGLTLLRDTSGTW